MKVGDVLSTTNVRHEFANGSVGYKAPAGKRFVFVLLGVEDKADGGEKLDCKAVFNALGWVPAPDATGSTAPNPSERGE